MSDAIFENSFDRFGNKQRSILDFTTVPTTQAQPTSHDGREFCFPNDFPVRDYQRTASRRALKGNSLICLPTGAGKTLIAAVVIRNFLNWYPDSQAIFVAWTKPLVKQQADAIRRDAGLSEDESSIIDGATKKRPRIWRNAKFICATPQCVNNDIEKGLVDTTRVKLVIVDEAHRTTGQHAYSQIIQKLRKTSKDFRIVGLTATPEKEKLYEVVKNLIVEDIVYYSASHPSINKFLVRIEEIIVPYTPAETSSLAALSEIGAKILPDLQKRGLCQFATVENSSPYSLLKEYERTKQNPNWSICWSTYDAFKQVVTCHVALRKFGMNKMVDTFEILEERHLTSWKSASLKAVAELKSKIFQFKKSDGETGKLRHLVRVLESHFENSNCGYSRRALVFVNDRCVVEEIRRFVMKKTDSNIRPSLFVGHGVSTTKLATNAESITQKTQLEQIAKFKKGDINVLIATSIGEEGLDIAECDLVVQYDHSLNQTRNAQRSGRTGRKGKGRIVYLMFDHEYSLYQKAQDGERELIKFMDKIVQQSRDARKKVWKTLLNYDLPDWPSLAPNPIPQPVYLKLHKQINDGLVHQVTPSDDQVDQLPIRYDQLEPLDTTCIWDLELLQTQQIDAPDSEIIPSPKIPSKRKDTKKTYFKESTSFLDDSSFTTPKRPSLPPEVTVSPKILKEDRLKALRNEFYSFLKECDSSDDEIGETNRNTKTRPRRSLPNASRTMPIITISSDEDSSSSDDGRRSPVIQVQRKRHCHNYTI